MEEPEACFAEIQAEEQALSAEAVCSLREMGCVLLSLFPESYMVM